MTDRRLTVVRYFSIITCFLVSFLNSSAADSSSSAAAAFVVGQQHPNVEQLFTTGEHRPRTGLRSAAAGGDPQHQLRQRLLGVAPSATVFDSDDVRQQQQPIRDSRCDRDCDASGYYDYDDNDECRCCDYDDDRLPPPPPPQLGQRQRQRRQCSVDESLCDGCSSFVAAAAAEPACDSFSSSPSSASSSSSSCSLHWYRSSSCCLSSASSCWCVSPFDALFVSVVVLLVFFTSACTMYKIVKSFHKKAERKHELTNLATGARTEVRQGAADSAPSLFESSAVVVSPDGGGVGGGGFSENSSYETHAHYERRVQRIKKSRSDRDRDRDRSSHRRYATAERGRQLEGAQQKVRPTKAAHD